MGEISGCGDSRFIGNGICPRGKHYYHLVLLVNTFLVTTAALKERAISPSLPADILFFSSALYLSAFLNPSF